MDGIESIAAERKRQIEVEGFTAAHDDAHRNGELSRAAACYTLRRTGLGFADRFKLWPWGREWWKPKTERENLVRAGALIAAEIDRLDRMEERQKKQ